MKNFLNKTLEIVGKTILWLIILFMVLVMDNIRSINYRKIFDKILGFILYVGFIFSILFIFIFIFSGAIEIYNQNSLKITMNGILLHGYKKLFFESSIYSIIFLFIIITIFDILIPITSLIKKKIKKQK
jgi:hypothetical protein